MVDQEFVSLYTESLQDLKANNKIQINNLTDLAREHEGDAESIAVAIEQYIQQCEPDRKLWVLYVLDSIVKNVREPYVETFTPHLLKIFSNVWDSLPSQHERLLKVLRLWKGFFNEDALESIRDKVGIATPGRATPLVSPESPGSYQPTRPAASTRAADPRVGVPLPAGYSLAPASVPYLSATVPTAVSTSSAAAAYAIPVTQAVSSSYPVQQSASTAMSGYQYHTGVPLQAQPAPMQLHTAVQQAPALSYQMPNTYAIPSTSGMYSQASLATSSVSNRYPPTQSGPSGNDDILTAILNINGILESSNHPSTSGSGSKSGQGLRSTEFSAAFIKEYHPKVIEELQELSEKHRPILLNIRLARRRRQKVAPVRQRQWLVPADQWITVTASVADAPPTFFEEPSQFAEEVPDCSEPVDESQTECAISGDAFETFWDDSTDTYRYRYAKRLVGEEAEAHGVPDGSLVNVKSLIASRQHALASSARYASEEEAQLLPDHSQQQTHPSSSGDPAEAVGQKRAHTDPDAQHHQADTIDFAASFDSNIHSAAKKVKV